MTKKEKLDPSTLPFAWRTWAVSDGSAIYEMRVNGAVAVFTKVTSSKLATFPLNDKAIHFLSRLLEADEVVTDRAALKIFVGAPCTKCAPTGLGRGWVPCKACKAPGKTSCGVCDGYAVDHCACRRRPATVLAFGNGYFDALYVNAALELLPPGNVGISISVDGTRLGLHVGDARASIAARRHDLEEKPTRRWKRALPGFPAKTRGAKPAAEAST